MASSSAESSVDPLFCPVGRAMDLIGDRWTLVLVRHLLAGPRGFQELRRRAGIAPRMLTTRLGQLTERGFIEAIKVGKRSHYQLTEFGQTLEPIVRSIALWWVRNAMDGSGRYRETAPATVMESLPFLLKAERAKGVHLVYEVRLTGKGAGVWTVTIDDGVCHVEEGYAERAKVRYTADARDWTMLAIGLKDDREAYKAGEFIKDGAGGSMAWYFHQPMNPRRPSVGGTA